jgi:hypothetical protein
MFRKHKAISRRKATRWHIIVAVSDEEYTGTISLSRPFEGFSQLALVPAYNDRLKGSNARLKDDQIIPSL